MRIRLRSTIAALLILAWSSAASAHDFWAGVDGPAADGKLTVFIGFGHNFPAGEAIEAEAVAERYLTPTLTGPQGSVALGQGAEPRAFATGEALGSGTYLAGVQTKVSFSGPTPSGYVRKSKLEEPSMTRCSYGASFGKAVVNAGGAADNDAAQKPLRHKLEIVPKANPASVKQGQALPVTVLFDGAPLPRATVEAYFAGFTEDNSAFAFSAPTNKDGEVSIIVLRPGAWLAKVAKRDPYSNLEECDVESYTATLTFEIGQ